MPDDKRHLEITTTDTDSIEPLPSDASYPGWHRNSSFGSVAIASHGFTSFEKILKTDRSIDGLID